MSRTKKRIPVILVCIGVAALVYFAGYIPFYTYEEDVLHTTKEQFFSTDHLVKLLPFVIIVLLAAACILILLQIREFAAWKKKDEKRFRRLKTKPKENRVIGQKRSVFMIVRWCCMIVFSVLVIFGGIVLGIRIAGIAFPVLACPTNMDQMLESSCYFLAHLPVLFEEYSAGGIVLFFVSTIGFAILFGRVICGFLCPVGLIQDIMDKIRQKSGTEGVRMNERRHGFLKPVKWLLVFLMLGITFAGGEFCSFCPALATSPILAGLSVSLYLSGFR